MLHCKARQTNDQNTRRPQVLRSGRTSGASGSDGVHVAERLHHIQFFTSRRLSLRQFGITKSAVDFIKSDIQQEVSISRLCRFVKGDTAWYVFVLQSIRDPNPKLREWQEEKVDPLIKRFKEKFGIELRPILNLSENTIKDEQEIEKLRKYLTDLHPVQLLACEISASAVRSICLGMLAVTGELSLESALYLSRLEEEWQAQFFGKVDGAHDIDEAQLLSHLTCARLLYLNALPDTK